MKKYTFKCVSCGYVEYFKCHPAYLINKDGSRCKRCGGFVYEAEEVKGKYANV
jgi:hypothetical protein